MRTRIYQVCIKYSMYDLISDVITVFEAGIRVKSRHPIKSCLKTRKKEKMWK